MQKCNSHCSGSYISCPGAESCAAPQLQAKLRPSGKSYVYRRVKTISRIRLPRSMGSTNKKCFLQSMGNTFSIFVTPAQRNCHFFFWHNHRRGVSKMANCDSHAAWEAKKTMLLTEHGKQIFHFCNPSRLILTFLAGFARLRPVCFTFCDISGPVSPPPLAPGVKITWVYIANSLKLVRIRAY